MDGLIWMCAVWGMLFAVVARLRHRSPVLSEWLSRENIALALALLGTFSIAAASEAAEVLEQPLLVERIIRGAFTIGALVLVTPVLVKRLRGYVGGHRALTGLGIYVAVALISTIYSAAALVTAAKVVELTAGLAPVVAIALGDRPAERLRSTLLLVMAMAASLVAVAVVGFFLLPGDFARLQSRPGFILQETMISPYAHSNALSATGAIVGVFFLASYLSGSLPRRLSLAAASIGGVSVVLSSGRQGVAMAMAGSAVVLWVQRRAAFTLLVGPAVAFAAYTYRAEIYDALARNRPTNFTNFTGRLYWWEAAIEAWRVHPWTGWGYGAGGRFVALTSLGRGQTSSVHSGYVEALVGVGILGVAGLAYCLVSVVAWSWRHIRNETAVASLIILLMLRTAVSEGFGGWLNVEFVAFALLAAIADQSRIDGLATRPAAPLAATAAV